MERTPSAAPTRRCRILLVDDNDDVLGTLGEILALCGNDVRTARDGATALRLADELRPDLAVLDLGMPRMTGYELAAALRRRHGPSIMLVALSGWATADDQERTRAAGFDRHLAKPAGLHTLRALAGEALARATELGA